MSVPAPSRRQHDVARTHVESCAVDDRVHVSVRLQHEAQRIGRVAVRTGPLSRQDHLVGADQGADAGVGIAFDGIRKQQVAPLGLRGGDEPACRIERRPRITPTPEKRTKPGSWERPQRGLVLVPARPHGKRVERMVELRQGRCVLSSEGRNCRGHCSFLRIHTE